MPYRREFYIAPGRRLSTLHIAPVVEASVWAGGGAGLQTCLAGARPLGFVLLTSDGGYWLPGPGDPSDLLSAIDRL